jgi:alanine racemase
MTITLSRPNALEVDLAAVAHNTGTVRRMVGAGARIFAALKANAYGFGLLEVADTVLAAGADALGVADLTDAIRLRQHGLAAPILLYASDVPDVHTARAIQQHDVMPTIVDEPSAEAFAKAARDPFRAWVKVDVGAGRLGVPVEDAVSLVRAVVARPALRLAGIYTHLHLGAQADTEAYAAWQFGRFEAVLRDLDAEGVPVPLRMAASTTPLLLSSRMTLNAVDPGQMLFGLVPPARAAAAGLRPAFRALTSRLIQVKRFRRTEFPHLAPLPLREGMRVGVIPMGFLDGLRFVNGGHVLVRGRPAPLGPVNVEHTRVDLTDIPEAEVGDEVVVIGGQGSAEISPDEVAERNGLKPAELAIAVRETVRRVYRR